MSGETAVAEGNVQKIMRPIRTVGVIGAGTMGSGIAQKAAMEGAKVILVDQGQAYLDKARASIETLLEEGQKRKVLRPEEAKAAFERLTFSPDLADLAECDLVIEAIYEDEQAKKALFSRLDEIVGKETVIATNTSSLSVSDLSRSTRRPERFVGMHFFFHPVKNRLVEVIPTEATDPGAYERVLHYARSSGKTPIEVKDCPGFAVNRFFVPWLNESVRMLEDGTADRATIDAGAMKAFGIGMGPFALMNATGVPIACHSAEGLSRALGKFYAAAELLKEQTEAKAPWTIAGEPDPARFDAVAQRLWGVVFWVAIGLADEGGAGREDIDRGARIGLAWSNGPFEAMNRRGLGQCEPWIRSICSLHGLEFPESLLARQGKVWELRYVESRKEGRTARIVLNRPETMNALDRVMTAQLLEAVEAAEHDDEVDCITLEGRGKAFMAGADIKFFLRAMEEGNLDGILRFTEEGQTLLRRIETSAKHVIALIDGPAIGGGTELALACRWRVVTPQALFRLPETGLGIYPGLGGTQRLSRIVGKLYAKYFILTGAPLPAQAAYALGVADHLCAREEFPAAVAQLLAHGPKRDANASFAGLPDKESVARVFGDENVPRLLRGEFSDSQDPFEARSAKSVAQKGPLALGIANELIDEGLKVRLEEGLQYELARIKEIFKTEDAREGLTSVLERRFPSFKGR